MKACIVFKNEERKIEFIDCSKVEHYHNGSMSFKDDEDGIIYSTRSEDIMHMVIIDDE